MNLYLIDGNSYVYRAFYAIRGLTNSKGFPTNAIFGFTNMLLKIIRDKKPDAMAVCFDSREPTERHRLFEEYKAHRPEMPSDLVLQFPHIREMVAAFNISILEMPGYEADDLIGTVARTAEKEGIDVFIVTADKDMLQLVNERVKVYDPMKDRLLDSEHVREKFGFGPERVTEVMALTGDSVDNIPGIKGVGEKTAKEILSFGSLDEILSSPELIGKEKLRKLVVENKGIVLMSRQLATIDTNAPVDVKTDNFRLGDPDWLGLLRYFREFEFTSLMKLIPAGSASDRRHETITTSDKLALILSEVKKDLAIDIEATGTNPFTDSIVGIAIASNSETSFYIPLAHTGLMQLTEQLDMESLRKHIMGPLRDENINKIGHNLKYDIMMLENAGLPVSGSLYDTMIASYLLNPNKAVHSLEEVSFEYLSKKKKTFAEVLNKRASFAEVPIEEASAYASEDAGLSFELKQSLFQKLTERGLERVYFDIEMPLVKVLIDMEKAGIKIDSSMLRELGGKLGVEIDSIQRRIYFLAGEEFNINSPKQLAKVLFQSLGLSPTKKTKTGYSTGMDVLEELAGEHELPKEVLAFRSLTKLKTTYLDVLPKLVNAGTGRIHTSFNQTVTATGRLSSSDPNLQNIPIRGEWGRLIREAFVAEEGNLLLSADYSQVELRILAHMSGDEGLCNAFRDGLDIHTRTASEIFGVAIDNVSADMRRVAKTVNFGVIYGISSFGLSETLSIDRKDAEKYIKQYFERHPGVKNYIEKTIRDVEEKGFASTLFGRKRPISELRSTNRNTRLLGERLAMNSPIQGTAADIIKLAMISIHTKLRESRLSARMILQVHDELLFELPVSELEVLSGIVRREMEGAIELSVPLKVELGSGRNWAEAH